jgi:phosphoserine aminotransferase
MARAHNFNAGPGILPVDVVKATAEAVIDFNGTGMGLMEVSHRSKEFDAVIKEAQSDCLKVMNLSPDEYEVLFLGGGASMQFLMVPYNFFHKEADYIVTGVWAKKALKEGKFFGKSNVAATSDDSNFNYLPKSFNFSPTADYVHITTNNTIYGTEYKSLPDTGNVPLVADMSSDFLGYDFDYSKCSLIYAGAQKNV